MWKHKNFINLQLHAGQQVVVNFDDGIEKVEYYKNNELVGEVTISGTATGSNVTMTTYFVPILKDGYEVDTYSGVELRDGHYYLTAAGAEEVIFTSKQSRGSTMTFKHLYDAGTIGTGTIKFRHYSQQEPSTGETWVLNESIDTTSEKEFTVNFNSKDVDYSAINLQYMRNKQIMDYVVSAGTGGIGTTVYSELESGWIDQAYRTITFETSPTGGLLTWLQANGTKQGGGAVT